MRGYLIYLLIVKCLLILLNFSHSTLDWTTALSWIFFWWFFKTFLEGSVDRIIYRDYIANRRSFIDSSLATVMCKVRPTRGGDRPRVWKSYRNVFLSPVSDQPGAFGQRDFNERKWRWAVGEKRQSKEWCVSPARADWLIAVCHLDIGDTTIIYLWTGTMCVCSEL